MMPSTKYRSARENAGSVGRWVGSGVGRPVRAGVAEAPVVGSGGSAVAGSVGSGGVGDDGGADVICGLVGDTTSDWLGGGADDPQAARMIAATLIAATSEVPRRI
jgi:hypothetical protein